MLGLPALKIGVWNAWILTLYFPLHPLIMIVVDKAIGTGEIFKKMGDVPFRKGEKRIFVITMVVFILQLAYSVFLPLKLSTMWFYTGLGIYLVGLVMILTAMVNIARTPPGQPFTEGLYRFSRHPIMISSSITFVGVGIATASWVFLLLSIVNTVLQDTQAKAEERGCLEVYGDAYQAYLDRTPRWFRMPKSK